MLYIWEFFGMLNRAMLDRYWEYRGRDPGSARDFAEFLALGVLERQEEIDDMIRKASLNWRLERMGLVDRNVLRIATFEMLATPETPLKVILNEAIELGKRYGTEESGSFVNGVMDKIGSLVRGCKEEGRFAESVETAVQAGVLDEGKRDRGGKAVG